jgi:hypothetical protein
MGDPEVQVFKELFLPLELARSSHPNADQARCERAAYLEIPPAEGRNGPAGAAPIAPSVQSSSPVGISRRGDGREGERPASGICSWCREPLEDLMPGSDGICAPCANRMAIEAGIPSQELFR